MEMHLEPLSGACMVSGTPFAAGDRVVSHLVRGVALDVRRCDVLASNAGEFSPPGAVVCRWVHVFKPKREDPERAMKLTAENLFLSLADPSAEHTPESARLVQFLALMMERRKIVRPKGMSDDGAKNLYEHAKTKQMCAVPAGELTPEFFVAVREQLGVLVGEPKAPAASS